jgi:hypothetical protein
MKRTIMILVGCFGDHPFDKMREQELDDHTDEHEEEEEDSYDPYEEAEYRFQEARDAQFDQD